MRRDPCETRQAGLGAVGLTGCGRWDAAVRTAGVPRRWGAGSQSAIRAIV